MFLRFVWLFHELKSNLIQILSSKSIVKQTTIHLTNFTRGRSEKRERLRRLEDSGSDFRTLIDRDGLTTLSSCRKTATRFEKIGVGLVDDGGLDGGLDVLAGTWYALAPGENFKTLPTAFRKPR